MSKEAHREIARRGGRAGHLKGTAHEWTIEEARKAGQKGGREVARRRLEKQRVMDEREG